MISLISLTRVVLLQLLLNGGQWHAKSRLINSYWFLQSILLKYLPGKSIIQSKIAHNIVLGFTLTLYSYRSLVLQCNLFPVRFSIKLSKHSHFPPFAQYMCIPCTIMCFENSIKTLEAWQLVDWAVVTDIVEGFVCLHLCRTCAALKERVEFPSYT